MSHVPLLPLPRRSARFAPVLPLVAVVALLGLPVAGDGAQPADVCAQSSRGALAAGPASQLGAVVVPPVTGVPASAATVTAAQRPAARST